jgi:hypothetical protein
MESICGVKIERAAAGMIGGLTPLVATWLVERTGDEIAPAFLNLTALGREKAPLRAGLEMGLHRDFQ